MAGAQLADRCVKRACRTGHQLRELLLVVLVAGGGDQEDHPGRAGTRVGGRVRAAAPDIHHAPWATVAPVCDCQLCRLPRVRTRGSKGEQVELVLPDPEAG